MQARSRTARSSPAHQESHRSIYAGLREEAIANVIRIMTSHSRNRAVREIQQLPVVLSEYEMPEMAAAGTCKNRKGLLVATDRRLLFVRKSPLSLSTDYFWYDGISSLSSGTWALDGELTIWMKGKLITFTNMEGEAAHALEELIRSKTNQFPRNPLPPAEDQTIRTAPLL